MDLPLLWFKICVHHFNIPLSIIRKTSQTCVSFHHVAAAHLHKCGQLRVQYERKIIDALYINYYAKDYPFKFTKTFIRTCTFFSEPQTMFDWSASYSYISTFSIPYYGTIERILQSGYMPALANMLLVAKSARPFGLKIRFYGDPHFAAIDYAESDFSRMDNGEYIIDLNLPTRYSPILLAAGRHVMHYIIFDLTFGECIHFTRYIAKILGAHVGLYNWNDYNSETGFMPINHCTTIKYTRK